MKQKHFQLAKKLSAFSDHPQHKLGAVITRGNRVISLGFNKNTTHTRSPHRWNRLHAEIAAIIRSKESLDGAEIYVYRETKMGNLGLARPCESCFGMIREVGIKKIYFSSETGYKKEFL